MEILRLVVATDQETPTIVAKVIDQALNTETRAKVIELLTDLLIRKFPHLTREEVNTMFMLADNDIKKTRFYQEVKEEGIEEGEIKAKSTIAINLLRMGMKEEQVAEVTGLPMEQVLGLPRNP